MVLYHHYAILGEEQLVSCHALHEWDSRLSGGVQWRYVGSYVA